jgi:mannitol/fructose-specific phosphotransferase system IIA component (Ntr-type)
MRIGQGERPLMADSAANLATSGYRFWPARNARTSRFLKCACVFATAGVTQGSATMKFADFMSTEAIIPEIAADGKEGVIREMVEALQNAGRIEADNVESIIAAIMKREELGSTGIGRGVAVPHTKHPSVGQLVGAVGVSRDGIDFNSLDGEKVNLVFLLVSPPDRPGDHLRALENISRQLRDDTFCRFLKQSKSAEDIVQLLEEADNNQFAT